MDAERLSELRRLVTLSESMLNAAKAADWDQLTALEPERRGAIEAFFSHAVNADESRLVGAAINRILELDDETAAFGREARAEASAQLRTLGQGRNADNAYRQNR